ncbi:hypothetical protein [Natrarchaeobius chitinivorans]|uniref:hypothetical protein n=1 Tax=Natrarchaeobius chitinivorans TaxID=1679083 RepID=UPI001404AAA3|nr:hypothetical protein [Natrarchaeobius chitinivorans]
MATKTPVECPLCRRVLRPARSLEAHLVDDHSKRELAKFVVCENEALTHGDVS